MKGYIQVYTGDGKGKTTAALGLAIRAVGAGKKVFFAQFVKGRVYSEMKQCKNFCRILPSDNMVWIVLFSANPRNRILMLHRKDLRRFQQ